MTILTG